MQCVVSNKGCLPQGSFCFVVGWLQFSQGHAAVCRSPLPLWSTYLQKEMLATQKHEHDLFNQLLHNFTEKQWGITCERCFGSSQKSNLEMLLVVNIALQSKNSWLVGQKVFLSGTQVGDVILTQCFVVFDLVSPSAKKCSGSFLEEALGGTGNVEIWCWMATASRQTLWTEALQKRKVGQCVDGQKGVTVTLIQSDIYRKMDTQRLEQTGREVENDVLPAWRSRALECGLGWVCPLGSWQAGWQLTA